MGSLLEFPSEHIEFLEEFVPQFEEFESAGDQDPFLVLFDEGADEFLPGVHHDEVSEDFKKGRFEGLEALFYLLLPGLGVVF